MVPPHALLMTHFKTFLALADQRNVKHPDQVAVVHTDAAHLPLVEAPAAGAQMLLQKEVVVVELLLEVGWLANEIEGEVAVA